MKRSKLIESINVNRARLGYAVLKQDQRLQTETLRDLVTMHAQYFDLTVKETVMEQTETKYLVFSERYPDGRVLTKVEYRALYKAMDHFDRETHQAIEVDGAMETDVEQALLGAAPSPVPKKAG